MHGLAGSTADLWATIALVLHVSGAIGAATLAAWLKPRFGRLGKAGHATSFALVVTALWSLAEALELRGSTGATVLEAIRNLSWLLVVYRLFADDGRHDSLAPIRPVLFSLVFVELLLLGVDLGVAWIAADPGLESLALGLEVMLRLLVTVGALVLVHNLYGGASPDARMALRWPAAALASLWIFELNLYTVAYLSGAWPREIAALRGLATIALVGLLGVGATHGREALRLRPSRAVTFQTFSLLLIGLYLVAMVVIAQSLAYMGGNFAQLIELIFVTVAMAVALLVLPSRRLRSWLKVTVSKHLFQHRYDYREEWLRFTRTIGGVGPEAPPLGERVIQALADVTSSPAGLLLMCDEEDGPALAARWNWASIDGTGNLGSDLAAFLERESFIADLDEMRSGSHVDNDDEREAPALPAWLRDDTRAWALVPLIHYDRLVAVVVLARPLMTRKLDWEDFDLLRVIGQQLASYLAEHASQEALAEAGRFDDFNRRIAFVMHDIKNLASQFSLLARNAELHAEKKAFRDDMIVTLRSSSEKLNALISRLSRYGSGGVDRIEGIRADEVARAVIARFNGNRQVRLTECEPLRAIASRHSLEQVLVHLVQNGLDASGPRSTVFLSVVAEGADARFEVIDSGSGMSPEFIRSRLFKPFVSTKSGGFGIGAFEARELVRAMRGRLDVESREGIGSRFIVRVPLQTGAIGASQTQEVA
ncbi:XrtA/PEP-CTERM system histidine kinase PrsK [uncultured Novosphingobium sp.]|uniref:XrtA/PEP-CTERM system histidine kinase PrsK n=1 Tax=uncultured Novosphingobium sp. TaxID=292277 RepID=UPI00258E13CF|nr:XrtA/PEP-CTERM system histidine kinase PrsK [uncultured Novosphingobium sp.]